MANPNTTKQKKLLMEFVDFIEQEGSQSGYLLVNKGNYKNNSMYFNEAPKKGDKTTINIRFTQERISHQDLEVQVDMFLRSVEDSI
tara:strand:+ start:718 stop:975 length:258 start_codon:yes stop_codon:yes gene_type:complete